MIEKLGNVRIRRNRNAMYGLVYELAVRVRPGRAGDEWRRICELTAKDLFEEKWGLDEVETACGDDWFAVHFSAPPHLSPGRLANSFKTVSSRRHASETGTKGLWREEYLLVASCGRPVGDAARAAWGEDG